HDDEEEQGPDAVTKYIESKTGSEFQVRSSFPRPFPGTTVLVDIHLDGRRVCGTFAHQECMAGAGCTIIQSGVPSYARDQWFERTFCFAELTIDDSGILPVRDKLKKTLDRIGEISVYFYKTRNLQQKDSHTFNGADISTVGTISEKVLKGKALSHEVSLQKPRQIRNRTVYEFEYIQPQKEPFASFCFRYRSRIALKALCIIPRSSSPLPLEDRPVEDLTLEEARELLWRQRRDAAARMRQEGVKREHPKDDGNENNGKGDEVTFVSVKRRKLPPTPNKDRVEVVDLT
ncbi:uncharacterized protein BDR25DRAFT_222507, partial [Lindgomyces ingoldianus]